MENGTEASNIHIFIQRIFLFTSYYSSFLNINIQNKTFHFEKYLVFMLENHDYVHYDLILNTQKYQPGHI